MARLDLGRARTTAIIPFVLALSAVTAGAAWAQTAPPTPRITSAPRSVDYRSDAVIAGRLDDGTAGQRVQLEKSVDGGPWRTIGRDLTDARARVRFRIEGIKRSAGYRLLYREEGSSPAQRSAKVRVPVKPKLTIHTSKSHLMQGRRVRIYGSLLPKVPGRRVVLGQRVGGGWKPIGKTRAGDGTFSTRFRPDRGGFRRLRVRFAGDPVSRRAQARGALKVYEPELATWYGPGFYGNRTACGQRLAYDTLGVAHRRLPCGTDVKLLYNGRTITVPVIDRGPYSSADWDLTQETADRLRFSGKETIGTRH